MDLLRVRIESRTVDVDVGREDTIDDRAQSAGNDLGVPGLTDGLVEVAGTALVNFRKRLFTVRSKVPKIKFIMFNI